ncbi:Hypothetical predicted protein [Paramuricea clavata]|uniref:Uncharacterized protein n=1 Tax=Paramuricea clavata TaxID=317549 RepID=A0A7D9IDY9_PARCT|nr:Hypothetical predicted protein [Paramuricea clavata]
MKSWTILALLVAICAVFLGVGHAEETADDFREAALEDTYSDTDENDVRLADSFVNRENDADDENDDEDDDESDGEDDDESDDDMDAVNSLGDEEYLNGEIVITAEEAKELMKHGGARIIVYHQ